MFKFFPRYVAPLLTGVSCGVVGGGVVVAVAVVVDSSRGLDFLNHPMNELLFATVAIKRITYRLFINKSINQLRNQQTCITPSNRDP